MSILSQINSPEDLKKLDPSLFPSLAIEIRKFLIESISKTGGHLASNLGVVELTLALHYCFNSPTDKIVWDVGHQSYVHKILTGRKDKFNTLRQFNGLSGFPKANESVHDHFDTGHSSTSISAAYGYAVSRDIKKETNHVLAVIGDGSITCGLAYEALNNAGRSSSNLIVILNDNQMSIDENVGGVTKHLSDIRTKPEYLNVKKGVHRFLNKMPNKIGTKISKFIELAKDSLKYSIIEPAILFEELGFTYMGPINGHDVNELIQNFNNAKKLTGPILLHVCTKKGKGYSFAQEKPENYHGVSSFDIKTGKGIKSSSNESYSEVFGSTVTNLAIENKNIVAISAAMPSGTGLKNFKTMFPNRFFDVGIAESHAVTFAAGIAKNGLIPIVALYSTFLQRAYDQILHDVCNQNLHVIFALDRAGIVGEDGETHQGLFDFSFLSHIPNMTIVAPKNKFEFIDMLKFAVDYNSPIAIRYPRGNASMVYSDRNEKIEIATSELIHQGNDIALISVGSMMDISKDIYENLLSDGFNPTLINARFIKPIDKKMIQSLNNYKYIFILEENIKTGGYYNLSLDEFNKNNYKGLLYSFSFPDKFIEHGDKNLILEKYSLDSKSIYKKISSFLKEDDIE